MDLFSDIVDIIFDAFEFIFDIGAAHARRKEYKKLPEDKREELEEEAKDTFISYMNNQNPNGF